jgi:hypothetical protein
MPAEDRLTLGELKKLIKDHMKTAPKLSSGKQNLLLYADKAGLLKKKEAPVAAEKPAPMKAEIPTALKKPVKEKEPKELPEALKKTPKEVKIAKEAAPSKKAPTAFAAFMSANKGKGYTMSQLSQMYRESKE